MRANVVSTKAHPGYLVSRNNPRGRRLRTALVTILLVSLAGLVYQLGYRVSGIEQQQSEIRFKRLDEKITYLKNRNEELVRQVATLERSQQIEHRAATDLKQALHDIEGKMLILNEELSFYRSIVSPSKMEPGLRVQAFHVENAERTGEYYYRLVLTQIRGKNRTAQGTVELRVEGEHKGVAKTLSLGDLPQADQQKLTFSFQYFQSLEGTLRLPLGFEPKAVSVQVSPKGKKLKPTTRRYRWAAALVGGKS